MLKSISINTTIITSHNLLHFLCARLWGQLDNFLIETQLQPNRPEHRPNWINFLRHNSIFSQLQKIGYKIVSCMFIIILVFLYYHFFRSFLIIKLRTRFRKTFKISRVFTMKLKKKGERLTFETRNSNIILISIKFLRKLISVLLNHLLVVTSFQ